MAADPRREYGYLQIGEVAERTGVTQRTLRFYEEKGLLKPPSRMEGGFRLYSEEDVRRVERIRQMQNLLGFTLAEIRELVEAEEIRGQIKAGWRRDADAAEKREQILRVQALTKKQHAMIAQKLEQLREMQSSLEKKLGTYQGWLELLDESEAEKAESLES